MILAENGRTEYRIVIGKDASPAVRHAAGELAAYLFQITGAAFPVEEGTAGQCGKEILLGAAGEAGAPGAEGLRNDGYLLRTEGERLCIIGENGRAVHYGVYGLLERHLGCRFFTEKVEQIPSRPTLEVPALCETVCPPLEYRCTSWNGMSRHPEFALKRGMNSSHYVAFPEKLGGSVLYNGFVHTFKNYIPDDEFFDGHPEYFAMVDGKRRKGAYSQLCLTNPDVFRIMLQRVLKSISEHPECKIVSLSQNDGFDPCTCPECRRVDAEEGGYSGTLIRFVNKLAREIRKVYPDVLVDTLAYRQTRQPPKISRPESNMCVRMCTIESCFSHPIEECGDESNAEKVDGKETAPLTEDLAGWGRICGRMFIWDYTTNFHHYLAPFPNFRVLQKNIQYFIRNHVTGLFEQGNGESVSGEFGELRAYLLTKLMWEPDGDVDRWTDEFLAGYYGAAAPYVREWIDIIEDHVTDGNIHVGIYNPPESYLTEEMLETGARLWDEAERVTEGEILERVRRSRLQLTYCELRRMPVTDARRAEKFETFERDVRRFGITRLQEFIPVEKTLGKLRKGDLTLSIPGED